MEFPKYNNSIVNLMASILTHFGAKSDYQTIPKVDKALNNNYKHVLLVVFDGFGEAIIKKHLEADTILHKNMVGNMQSVYPSTTTAAMTSYYSGISPAEHGWLGWSLQFRDYGGMIDIFPNTDSTTGQPKVTKKIAYREMPFESVFDQINAVQNGQVELHSIKPEDIYFPSTSNRHHPARDLGHMIKIMKKILAEDKPSYTLLYYPEPDSTMHQFGPNAQESMDKANALNQWVENLCANLDETLVIVSADHGQIEVEKELNLETYESIKDMLVIPPSIEGRCASFFVKHKYYDQFRPAFEKAFGDDFILLSHEQVIEKQLFGKGTYHKRFDDFVGDFVACATGNSLLKFKTIGGKEGHDFKGHHAGLQADEMTIPLILIDTRK